MPFKKTPLADAQAAVEKLENDRAKLAGRLAEIAPRLEEARRLRREALVEGTADEVAMGRLDKTLADAAEVHGAVEEAARELAGRLEEAIRHRDGLQDQVDRANLASDAEIRAGTLDSAAERLTTAARAFRVAVDIVEGAIADHGIRVSSAIGADGSTPIAWLARPIVLAAVRLAAPGVLPRTDGLGEVHGDDPVVAMRRAQSGLLRDHAEDLQSGRVAAAELPRPNAPSTVPDPSRRGSAQPVTAGNTVGHTAGEPLTRTVFAVPVKFVGVDGVTMVEAPPGDTEVPVRVGRKAEELELSFSVDSDAGRAIVARLKASGGQYRACPWTFIDTSDSPPIPAGAPRSMVTTTWPDERETSGRRA